ncbi:hypothetical protein TEA_017383 [Camellia sinensis var. sinensis]|uniref:Uncharacterized protein n=1 Tax=Camellia sinensis var. sinensis TaxID=542762 RepID=A0A4S4DZ29_CAMSN|nr:hypothetical protein TEA_017383 [Camellia sinensis var. sinensis]
MQVVPDVYVPIKRDEKVLDVDPVNVWDGRRLNIGGENVNVVELGVKSYTGTYQFVIVIMARKLEAQLDEQMHLYRKLVSTKTDDGTDKDLELGIDQLLQHLQQVNSHMQAWVSSGGSEIFSHTLTRHQEILQDLTQEFNRLRSSLRAKKEHASLLEDFREFDRTRLDLEESGGSYDQALLKEHASVNRSTGQDVVGDSKARVSEQMGEIRSAVEIAQLEAEKKHDEVVDEMLAMLNAKAEASRLKEVEQEVGKDVDEEQ